MIFIKLIAFFHSRHTAVIPQEETDKSVEISTKLAELSKGLRENEVAINHYKDALKLSGNNIKILIALAKQYMQVLLITSFRIAHLKQFF